MFFSGKRFWFLLLLYSGLTAYGQEPAFRNSQLPAEARAGDLLSRLSLQEKISLLSYDHKGVPRLQVPKYNWWNEALHGVARAGRATVFPQAIAMAATFNDSLIEQVAAAISDEARAKFNAAVQNNNRAQYLGLTMWSPNINIFRDPRWGRGHETYGEDPLLTARTGAAFVKGLQGNHPLYYKTIACAKHFAVHSGPEPLRHEFNAQVSDNDLRNTYLPAFKTLVTDAKAGAVMCAYNRTNGIPCCTHSVLLQDILRKEWNFKGYIVSDCWALEDIHKTHKYTATEAEAAALAVKSGVNVECGTTFSALQAAVSAELLTEKDIDRALLPNLVSLFKLGLLNKASETPFHTLNEKAVNNEKHRRLARQTALQSIVLLSNKNKTLPLPENIHSLLVTGPNADVNNVLLANYNGLPGSAITFLEGITQAVSASTVIYYGKGCELTDTTKTEIPWQTDQADAVIAVLGLSPLLEGENGDANLSEAGGDKKDIRFPQAQLSFLKKLREKTKKPVIAVIATGSAVELQEVEALADAVLLAWYPGEQGGAAAADIIFGLENPSGRLPVTFYRSTEDLPPFEEYSMKERTYRYLTKPVQYPFGFGLSYTSFDYTALSVTKKSGGRQVTAIITNTGERDGAEVVQLYVKRKNRREEEPLLSLKNFKRVWLKKGASAKISFTLTNKDLEYWDASSGRYLVYPDEYEIFLGASSANPKLHTRITVTGN